MLKNCGLLLLKIVKKKFLFHKHMDGLSLRRENCHILRKGDVFYGRRSAPEQNEGRFASVVGW